MWQRFTERARKVVFYAQEEAQRFSEENKVSSEHLLLGLCHENDTVAARILEQPLQAKDMFLTPASKFAIDCAYEEARGLSNNYIGTEHLLLGILHPFDGNECAALAALGVHLKDAREQTRKILDEYRAGQPEELNSQAGEASEPVGCFPFQRRS
jgi:ATP-dependent Clp protease ATP-binding subunit ClpC